MSGLGDRDFSRASEQDRLTEVCFDDTGNHIAVGDKGGRVIVFKYKDIKNSSYFDYRYLTEFQSHEPKFDHLSSQEVCESIKRLVFVPNRGQGNLNLLSANDKLIKLWRLSNQPDRETSPAALENGRIIMPKSKIVGQGCKS